MKSVLICVAVGLSLLASAVLADATITTRLQLKEHVRQQLHIYATTSVPDSEMNDFANRALLWTSVVAGGVQSRVRIITTAKQAFYVMPDTLVEVLAQTLKRGDYTKSIKATYPQFSEEMGVPTSLPTTSSDPDVIPTAWISWDDTLQLIPVPQKVDTLWFYCHVEHPSLSADTMAVRLRPAYSEAAVFYCAFLILQSLEEYSDAAINKKLFDEAVVALRERYRPKFDILSK